MTARRTWWHLEDAKRKPSDYEIATTKLLYYPARGFEVRTPAGQWLLDHQRACPLKVQDWDQFRDPRETTYTKYTTLQSAKEIFVDALFRSVADTGYDQRLTAAWLTRLDGVLPTLLYPFHGFQMVAAYVGQMAPGGRLVVTSALQAADEMRRVQRLAFLVQKLQLAHPEFGQSGKATWQQHPQWQPLRRAIEQLLVTYDWGEAFTALNLVLKPACDALFLVQLARLAERSGDEIFAKLLGSFDEDARWHREWTRALLDFCNTQTAENAVVFGDWIAKWRPICDAAIEPFESLFDGEGKAVIDQVRQAREACSMGLQRNAS